MCPTFHGMEGRIMKIYEIITFQHWNLFNFRSDLNYSRSWSEVRYVSGSIVSRVWDVDANVSMIFKHNIANSYSNWNSHFLERLLCDKNPWAFRTGFRQGNCFFESENPDFREIEITKLKSMNSKKLMNTKLRNPELMSTTFRNSGLFTDLGFQKPNKTMVA